MTGSAQHSGKGCEPAVSRLSVDNQSTHIRRQGGARHSHAGVQSTQADNQSTHAGVQSTHGRGQDGTQDLFSIGGAGNRLMLNCKTTRGRKQSTHGQPGPEMMSVPCRILSDKNGCVYITNSDQELWLPKSVIEIGEVDPDTGLTNISVPEWLAAQKGLS